MKSVPSLAIVAVNKNVVENIVASDARLCVIGLVRILKEDARFKARTLILPDPS